MVAEVYKVHSDTCYSLPCVFGDTLKPNAISVSAHQPGGACTGPRPTAAAGARFSPTRRCLPTTARTCAARFL